MGIRQIIKSWGKSHYFKKTQKLCIKSMADSHCRRVLLTNIRWRILRNAPPTDEKIIAKVKKHMVEKL
jgi:protein gp37